MIALLLAAVLVPPIRIVEQREIARPESPLTTHFRIQAGSSTLDFDLIGHVRSDPYEVDSKTALSPREDMLALTLVNNGKSMIYLVRSTPRGLMLERDLGERVTKLLYARSAQARFVESQSRTRRDKRDALRFFLQPDSAWKKWVDTDLAPHLWVEHFGGFHGMEKGIHPDDLFIASQPAEVNHAFMFVRVLRDGRLKLIEFWHEGE